MATHTASNESQSQRLETSDTARGSNLLIQGSEVTAGGKASLSAEGAVNLLAAQNTVTSIYINQQRRSTPTTAPPSALTSKKSLIVPS